MTITNTSPQDYERVRRRKVVDNRVKICPHDGGRIVCMPRATEPCCINCRRTDFIWRWESEIEYYRAVLRAYRVIL